jgi:AcrR family transcriptional regulator
LVDQPNLEVILLRNQNKKQIIIEAASKVLAEKGYEKASIKDIAREAGITPGLVHYYFRNKEEILSELLLEASNQYTRDMQTLKQTVPVGRLSHVAIRETRDRVVKHPEWYKLRYELFAIGLRNSSMTEGVNRILENGRNGIAGILSSIFPEPEDLDVMAAILLACFDGLALQKLLHPELDLDKAYAVLEKWALSLQDAR